MQITSRVSSISISQNKTLFWETAIEAWEAPGILFSAKPPHIQSREPYMGTADMPPEVLALTALLWTPEVIAASTPPPPPATPDLPAA